MPRNLGYKHLEATSIVVRNLQIYFDSHAGRYSIQQLSEKYGISTRQVYRILADSSRLSDVIQAVR